ncbi:MAG TPA: RES family NAD+ phosphorylase [Conexibacter sp.]
MSSAFGRSAACGGAYSRLAEPGWDDPLDTGYSKRVGGRWNAPGSYGVLYLNASDAMARLQVHHRLAGQPFGVEDLDPSEQHELVRVTVADGQQALDCVSAPGVEAVGLPPAYPRDADGAVVPHAACQPIGAQAREHGLAGVACRSVAGRDARDTELALFDTVVADVVTETARLPFADWFWPDAKP